MHIHVLVSNPTFDPSADDNFAIWTAAEYGHVEYVRLLLADLRVNPAANSNRAIRIAAENGHTGCVRLLLADPRVDPGDMNNYAIIWAAVGGHLECVRLLLAHPKVDPAARGSNALLNAALHGHMKCARLLLEDPRVDPSAGSAGRFRFEIRHLARKIQAYKDGDLAAFEQAKLVILSNEELDILVLRNRAFPDVRHHLFLVQMARLAVSKAVREDCIYKELAEPAAPRRPWRAGELASLTEAFVLLQERAGLPAELAGRIAVQSLCDDDEAELLHYGPHLGYSR